jgi:hypothetical protein
MFKTICAQYPTAPDKERLWNEFESFAVVTSLSRISEFENHFQQHVYPLKQWPSGPEIMASITNYADAMLKLQKDNNHGEVQANSASSDARAYALGPCFNCGGTHLSRECKREPIKCHKCGRSGHMADFCDRVQSHNTNWQDKKKEYGQSKSSYPNSTYPTTYSKTSSKFPTRSSQSYNPKSKSKTFRYKHDKSKRHKKTLARLIIATDEDEPDLNKIYLSQLLSSPGDWVEFYEDELCRSEDAIEDDIEEYNPEDDEVYYAPEIDRADAQSAYDDNQEFTRTSYSRGQNSSSNWPQQSSTTSSFFSQNFQTSIPSSPALSALPSSTTKSFNRNDMYITQPGTPSNNVKSFSQIDQPFFSNSNSNYSERVQPNSRSSFENTPNIFQKNHRESTRATPSSHVQSRSMTTHNFIESQYSTPFTSLASNNWDTPYAKEPIYHTDAEDISYSKSKFKSNPSPAFEMPPPAKKKYWHATSYSPLSEIRKSALFLFFLFFTEFLPT